ncbi:MAG: DUF4878 domain-containing protein [Acidobacteria bacterium]|nr:DUF4878 domain-containing protein [Acidobacteriota bacterium]
MTEVPGSPPSNYAATPPPPNHPATPPPRKGGGWIKWVALGCFGLLLVAGLIGGGIWWGVMKATEGPETVAEEFLAAAAAGDYEAAHSHFSAPLKEVQPLEQFSAIASAQPSLFAVTDTTFSNRSVTTDGAELEGTVTLESGTKLPATFKLVKENGDWKLLAYHLGS